MQRYISLLLVIVLSALVILPLGCGGRVEPAPPAVGNNVPDGVDVDDIPDWFLNPPEDPDNLYAATTSSSTDLFMAFETAEDAGRADITSEIQTKVIAMFRRFRHEVGAGEDSELESLSEAVSQKVVAEVVSGIRRELGEVRQEGSMTYRVYILMKMPIGLEYTTLVKKVRENRSMYTRFSASEAFKELEAGIEKYENEQWEEFMSTFEEVMPAFPWPPPRSSARIRIPSRFFEEANKQFLLKDIAKKLEETFDQAGYVERSYYSVPEGFALVSRLEQFNSDGTPKEEQERWSVRVKSSKVFSLSSYIKALFTANAGHYRVIVFTVTSVPIIYSDNVRVDSKVATDWVQRGIPKLPPIIGKRPFLSEHYCTALIYEFEQVTPDHEAVLKNPGNLTGRKHLEKSNLWDALARD